MFSGEKMFSGKKTQRNLMSVGPFVRVSHFPWSTNLFKSHSIDLKIQNSFILEDKSIVWEAVHCTRGLGSLVGFRNIFDRERFSKQ